MNVLKPSISGNYELIGDPAKADCVIGQSFGANEDEPGYINELLARYIVQKTNYELPLLLQSEIANALDESDRTTSVIIEGQPSTAISRKLDSWSVLKQARGYMDNHDLNHPILVAQAHHVGRVCLQAVKQGMEPIIMNGLPNEFDPESTQFWTRSKMLWIPREIIGIAYLKVNNKL